MLAMGNICREYQLVQHIEWKALCFFLPIRYFVFCIHFCQCLSSPMIFCMDHNSTLVRLIWNATTMRPHKGHFYIFLCPHGSWGSCFLLHMQHWLYCLHFILVWVITVYWKNQNCPNIEYAEWNADVVCAFALILLP